MTETSSEIDTDLNDILLVAWVLLLDRYMDGDEIQFTWRCDDTTNGGCYLLPASLASSTEHVLLEEHIACGRIGRRSIMSKAIGLHQGCSAQQHGTAMFSNDASVLSGRQ